ncbi:MAG TPA: DUF3592 domain-containing protein [Planctomycetota bacterium]|jgi:hypothetical protein|nr:DUF3592 domain-containing protein [Planctomycetota bacterium]
MSVTGSGSESAKKARQGRVALGCFFTVFLIIGLLATLFLFVIPVAQILGARNWRATPCVIRSSEVGTHTGSKGGRTYSIDITYEYTVEEQRYVSSRYQFMPGSSSGYDGKKAVVDRLPPGTAATCYVDKRNPSDAVLERGFTGDLFFGLIPMIFALIGGGGLLGVFVFKGTVVRKKSRGAAPASVLVAAGPAARGGGTTLKPSASPVGRFGCSVLVALFWNGIVSVFFFQVASGWIKGEPDGCMTLFIIPFLLVGLGLIVFVLYSFLALFNPRPVLRVTPGSAALGDSVEVEWETSGNVDRIRSFSIVLEGREEATYRRGTSTSTDKSTFATIEVVRSPRGKDLRRGRVKVAIPADTMHSFKSSNNKFLWTFQVKGEIPRWPDVNEEFPFEVLPQRLPPGGRS